jgi:hypothetical protein
MTRRRHDDDDKNDRHMPQDSSTAAEGTVDSRPKIVAEKYVVASQFQHQPRW